jgi:hypothetical protein
VLDLWSTTVHNTQLFGIKTAFEHPNSTVGALADLMALPPLLMAVSFLVA